MNGSYGKNIAYVGSYTYGRSNGIYALSLDSRSGKLENTGIMAEINTSPYFVMDRDRKFFYTLTETNDNNDKSSGAIAAYTIDRETAKLSLINIQPTKSRVPVHINTDKADKFLFVANFREGTVSVFSINSDGSIGKMLSEIAHEGSGPHKVKQTQPHAHFVTLTPDEKHLIVADMGIDKIVGYDFDHENGSIKASQKLTLGIKSGSGPRHMEFHPDGRHLYLLNQLSSDIVALEYTGKEFIELQYISSLPQGFQGVSSASAIHISPDGNFLYASNRFRNSVSCFRIDKTSGLLEFASDTLTTGDIPRDFAIDPTGKFMLIGHQDSDTVIPFSIDNGAGRLEQAGDGVKVNNPVCIRFL